MTSTREKYGVVYADPPWQFGSKQLQKYDGERFASLESREYPTLSVRQLRVLPVPEIVAPDAALFLWVTDGHLPEGLSVMESWGFKYSTVAFVWSKKTVTGKQVATLGAWTMKNCELCLFGTRGTMLKHKGANNQYQLVEAERTNHSRKPGEVRSRIDRIFPILPRLELFARDIADGWDAIGNDVDGNDIRVSLIEKMVELGVAT
ncbi:MAG: MT-A70 family methyltransferase [Candidatus Bathyanammoxibius sp.]